MTRPIDPDSADVLHAWIEQYLSELHTAFPARVESYDASKQTIDAKPLIKHAVEQADGSYSYEDLPVIPCVPVIFPRTTEWFITLPIAAGDIVLVVCCESAIGSWWAGDGTMQYPGDLRRHHPSHAVAIPGLFPKGKALSNVSTSDLVLGKQNGVTLRLTDGGDILLNGGGSNASSPVAHEGSRTHGHFHQAQGMTAGPYPVQGVTSNEKDSIDTGEGSQHVKVPT